jgi:dTDP-glucose 4,6-dehydratase
VKRLLVTGGAGFIGSHFVDLLLKSEKPVYSKIVILDLLTYSGLQSNVERFNSDSRVEFIHGDIADRDAVREMIQRFEIDSIVNFAAESHVDRSIYSAMPFAHTNFLGLTNLLEGFRDFCKGRFIQISTDEVYGSISQGSWSEDRPLSPNSPYSASKAGADLMALAFARTYNLDICITRSSNNYGPRQFPEKVIPLFVTNLIDGKKVPLYGQGLNVRDWIHVTDNCRAIKLVFEHGKSGEIYNIGGGRELSNLELTKLILSEFNKPIDFIERVVDRAGHDFRYSVDDQKIRKELGFSSAYSFEVGLRETITWYKENENWWRPLK